MAIRFTEFITHNDHQLNLYVVQEPDDGLCFKVHVKDGDVSTVMLCRNEDNKWKFSPQTTPEWVDELKSQVVSAIEKRIETNGYHVSRPEMK